MSSSLKIYLLPFNSKIKYKGDETGITGKDAEQLLIPFDLTNFDK